MGQPLPLFRLFSVFFKQTLQFLQYVKNVHPVYGAGIRTHDLRNVSLFPWPLDQGSRPIKTMFGWQHRGGPLPDGPPSTGSAFTVE